MSDHTPGEWELTAGRTIKTGSGEFYLTYESDDNGRPKWRGTFVELDSNARLVSAAPELLNALRGLIEQLEGIGIPDWHGAEGLCLEQAKAALSNAKWGNDAQN